MITAHDLMTEDPVTVSMMGKVQDAARLLQSLDVRHLPVVDEEGTLVGMLSDRDLRGVHFPRPGSLLPSRRVGAVDAGRKNMDNSDNPLTSVAHDIAAVLEHDGNVRAVFGAPMKRDTRP
jgi:CBS-domain-containing membrane protein